MDIQKEFRTNLKPAVHVDDTTVKEFNEVIDPHDHALDPYHNFVKKYLDKPKPVLFLGMNAGPNGMAKYGIPFGDVLSLVEWIGVTGEIRRYDAKLKKETLVPIQKCVKEKREQSGKRLWNLIKELNEIPENFFGNCFVHNYCPLAFTISAQKGKKVNASLQRLKQNNKAPLEEICDTYLEKSIQYLKCSFVVAVGEYAEKRARSVVAKLNKKQEISVIKICHPSPLTRLSETKWRHRVKQEIEKHPEVIPLITKSQDTWKQFLMGFT